MLPGVYQGVFGPKIGRHYKRDVFKWIQRKKEIYSMSGIKRNVLSRCK